MTKTCIVLAVAVLVPLFLGAETEDPAIKGIKPERAAHSSPIELLSTGGPDDFGYEWIDSEELGGPLFSWVEIAGTGTNMVMGDDSHYWGIPFPFTFYGTSYDTLAVGSNGPVYFIDNYLGLGNTPIPDSNAYNVDTFIAVYWDDLDPSTAGAVYYEIIGDTLIVEWDNVPLYGTSDYQTFQVLILGSTGDIVMQYHTITADSGSGATIGIQGSPVTPPLWGLEYAYNSPVLYDGLAIRFFIAARDVGTSEITVPTPVPEDTTFNPTARVMNYGNIMESFDVTCEINPGAYTSTAAVSNLDYGDSIEVTFPDPFTFSSGPYTVTVYTQLMNDANTANDTLEKIIDTYEPGVTEGEHHAPATLGFHAPTINTGRSSIEFSLPQSSTVTLVIYDALGTLRTTLLQEQLSAGKYRMNNQLNLPGGVYFYSLQTDLGEHVLHKFTLIK